MDNQIELNKFYLIYTSGPEIIYPYQYYGKYGNRIRYHRWFLCSFVWDLANIEGNNYVDINSESSIRDFIWVCPDRKKVFTSLVRQLNYKLFGSPTINIYESNSAVDFVRYILDNFNHNTVCDLHRHNFEPNCDAIQQKN